MWDLMRGQAAASTRIGIEADLVKVGYVGFEVRRVGV